MGYEYQFGMPCLIWATNYIWVGSIHLGLSFSEPNKIITIHKTYYESKQSANVMDVSVNML